MSTLAKKESKINTTSGKQQGPQVHLDRIEAGFVYGWVHHPQQPQRRYKIAITVNGELLTSGLAANLRADLAAAKIGDGTYGFQLPIAPIQDLKSENEILVFDEQTNQPIEIKTNNIAKYFSNVVEISGCTVQIKDAHLTVDLTYDKRHIPFTLTVTIDNLKVHENAVTELSGNLKSYVLIPKRFLDGEPHQIKIFANHIEVAQDYFISSFQLTPWKYIAGDQNEALYSSLNALARFRYESLQHAIGEKTTDELAQLAIAHKALVSGFENNKTFLPLEFKAYSKPMVSIIIPAHNNFAITYHCLCSLLFSPTKVSFEVILADDASTDQTALAEDYFKNIRVVRNEENLLFLQTCNRAAKFAKGEFLVFLNNDTEVTKFWLDELINVFSSDEKAGLVGAKLLNYDGSLQEAGGVIWKTGTPWNVGYGQNAFQPTFNYLREADYVSGAAMCIRKKVWDELEGFSPEFIPAYFEDTDLAFKVKSLGLKVIYTPHSQVIHFEGMSNGKDITKGVKKYQKVNEKTFKKKWAKVFKSHGDEGKNLHLEIDRAREKRILVIDYQTPTLNNDAGSYAAIKEMELLSGLGFKVTFVPDNMAYAGKHTTALQKLGIEVVHAPFAYSVKELITSRGSEFDAVYITRFYIANKYIQHIRNHSQAKIVFNNADLHFLRELRAAQKNAGKIELAIQTRDEELKVMREVDAVLTYNEVEQAVILSHNLSDENLHICPWVVNKNFTPNKFDERSGIVFLGNFGHPPNAEAVKFICKEVMPKLHQVAPHITLSIYGSNITPEIEALSAENVLIKGFAPSLYEVYNEAKIFIAPLLSGAGIKGKVMDAMSMGTPCILTPVAAEGTKLTHNISCLIATKADEWVDAISKLYKDQKLWNKLRENSGITVESSFSYEVGLKKMKEIFDAIDIYV